MATSLSDPDSSSPVSVVLTAADIPGAYLSEPLECHAVQALRWWLLCRGIKVPTSQRKPKLIERIHKAIEENAEVIDVDGSYLYKKSKKLEELGVVTFPLQNPDAPLSGWESLTETTAECLGVKIPRVTAGTLYNYLSSHAGRSTSEGTFRALTRGYTHWASGRIDHLEINTQHPDFCHVRSTMKPSMKKGVYNVWLLLKRAGPYGSVQGATCTCAAGKSASCTHVSALLHALTSIAAPQFQLQPAEETEGQVLDDDDVTPVTSRPCQWKPPRKRKESTMRLGEAHFEKHVYGRQRKRALTQVEDFDPRPLRFRGTAHENLPQLLESVRSQSLCISLLFDRTFRHWESTTSSEEPALPSIPALRDSVNAFKTSLAVSAEEIRKIERETMQQRNSPVWLEVRRYRLTASLFGDILQRKLTTPPDSLVLRILQPKQFTSAAVDWGVAQESTAIQQYIHHQRMKGHIDLAVTPCGFHISEQYPYLGATPDGAVYDPSCASQPFGFLEVKCPYAHRNVTPEKACSAPGFCCTLEGSVLTLRRNHKYFAQIQGQMAIGCREWCDFVIFTTKGIHVQRISFDRQFWENTLLPKLLAFYDNCLGPEIVSPIHVLGLPMRNLGNC